MHALARGCSVARCGNPFAATKVAILSYRVVTNHNRFEPNFEHHPDSERKLDIPLFLPNPTENWGPKARAGRSKRYMCVCVWYGCANVCREGEDGGSKSKRARVRHCKQYLRDVRYEVHVLAHGPGHLSPWREMSLCAFGAR